MNRENYAEWLIRESVALKDWTKDATYDIYLKELIKKEPAQRGIERSVKCMQAWGEEKDKTGQTTLKKYSTSNTFTRGGKIHHGFFIQAKADKNYGESLTANKLNLLKILLIHDFGKGYF